MEVKQPVDIADDTDKGSLLQITNVGTMGDVEDLDAVFGQQNASDTNHTAQTNGGDLLHDMLSEQQFHSMLEDNNKVNMPMDTLMDIDEHLLLDDDDAGIGDIPEEDENILLGETCLQDTVSSKAANDDDGNLSILNRAIANMTDMDETVKENGVSSSAEDLLKSLIGPMGDCGTLDEKNGTMAEEDIDLIKLTNDTLVSGTDGNDGTETPPSAPEAEVLVNADTVEKDVEITDDQEMESCPQALQAADEEGLLEEMDEPEIPEPEDEPLEEVEEGEEEFDSMFSALDDENSGTAQYDTANESATTEQTAELQLDAVDDDEPPAKRQRSEELDDARTVSPNENEKLDTVEIETEDTAILLDNNDDDDEEQEDVVTEDAVTETVGPEVDEQPAELHGSTVEVDDEALNDRVDDQADDQAADQANDLMDTTEADEEVVVDKIIETQTVSASASADENQDMVVVEEQNVVEEKVSKKSESTEVSATASCTSDPVQKSDEPGERTPVLPNEKEVPPSPDILVIDDDDEDDDDNGVVGNVRSNEDEINDDDDDDVVNRHITSSSVSEERKVSEASGSSGTLEAKRPNEATEELKECSVKKVKLADAETTTVDGSTEGKLDESKESFPKEEKKSFGRVEPLKIKLTPEPMVVGSKPVKMEFMQRFRKPLEQMTRSDLEEFVLNKIVEAIVFKSDIAEMQNKIDSQEKLLLTYRQKVHELSKQFQDLKMVHERVSRDLQNKNQRFVTPVKITRAVGLQVVMPRIGTSLTAASTSKSSVSIRLPPSVSITPTAGSSAAKPSANGSEMTPAKVVSSVPYTNRITFLNRSAPGSSTVRLAATNVTTIPRQAVTHFTTVPKAAISSTTGSPSLKSSVIGQPQSNAAVSTSPASVAGGSIPVVSASAGAISNSATVVRKKPLQKFTPMRPPLSLTQQVQQDQQARQQQEQLLRQTIQQAQSRQTQSPQGTPSPRTPDSTIPPALANASRKKVQIAQSPSVQPSGGVIAPTSSASDGSLIDLTNEDDTPKANGAANRSSPAMVNGHVQQPQPSSVSQQQHQQQQQLLQQQQLQQQQEQQQQLKQQQQLRLQQQQQQQQQQLQQQQPKQQQVLYRQQHRQVQQTQQNGTSLPPLVAINNHTGGPRPVQQPRAALNVTVSSYVNGAGRAVLVQRPGMASNCCMPAFQRIPQTMYRPRHNNGSTMAPRRLAPNAVRRVVPFSHPAPLPSAGPQPTDPGWKQGPPRPAIRINNVETGIVISWTMDELSTNHAMIMSYQIYAYQETTAPPSSDMWRHVGDVKAMLLPMAVTLTQFQEGQRYHFAVRAVDEHGRKGSFSLPRTWNESAQAKSMC